MKYNFNKPLLDLEDKPTEIQINKMFSNLLSSSPVGNPDKFTYWAKELWAGREIIIDEPDKKDLIQVINQWQIPRIQVQAILEILKQTPNENDNG